MTGPRIAANQLLTVPMTHAQTGVPMRTLYHRIKTGALPHIRIGNRILIHADDVADLVENRPA